MEAAAVEQRRPVRETPMQRFGRDLAAFFAGLFRTVLLAGLFTPILLGAFLTVDIPVRNFDHLFDFEALKPGRWLTVGALVMALGAPVAILMARRYGGDEASRAVTAAWGLAAVGTFFGLSWLAPVLEAGDFPSVRFVVAFVASALIGQYAAIGLYDLVRGGGPWWRAPLIAVLSGYAVQALVYFPAMHWSAGAIWFNWMIADFALRAGLAVFLFLPVYRFLQKPLRPVGGYGGR